MVINNLETKLNITNSNKNLINLPLVIGTLGGVAIGFFFRDVKISVLASAIIATFIGYVDLRSQKWRNFQNKYSHQITIGIFLLSILTCFAYSQTFYFIEPYIRRLLPVIFFLSGLLITTFLVKKHLREISFGIDKSLALLILYGFAVGHTFLGYHLKDLASWSVMFFGGGVAGIFDNLNLLEKKKRLSLIFNKIGNVFFIFISALTLLAVFRKDFLDWAHSSLFHWFYFVGPVSEYQAGNGIETLNQYSQGALMIASNISNSAWHSVYIFQIILYFLTILFLILIGLKKNLKEKLVISSISFLLLFADPASVGPQAYPSAGLLRFFPLIVWSLYFYTSPIKLNSSNLINKFKKIYKYVIPFFALATSFLWSSEIAICTSLAIFIVISYRYVEPLISNLKLSHIQKIYNKKLIFIILFISTFIFIFLKIFASDYLKLINTTYFEQLIAYPLSYLNKGYGWHEPGAWITISPLYVLSSFCGLVLLSNFGLLKKIGFIACSGLVCGYVAYRPVSNNLTAALPSVLILVSSFLSKDIFLKSSDSKKNLIPFRSLNTPFKAITIAIAGTSFLLQIGHLERVKNIINISTGKTRGYFATENGGMDILDKPNCKKGDEIIANLIKDKNLLKNIRDKKTGISYIGAKYNYSYELGNCYEYNEKKYHPFIFQPIQLYNAPLDKEVSKIAVKKALNKRKFNSLIFLSDIEDERENSLRDYFFKLLPNNWNLIDTYETNKRFEVFIWEKQN